MQVVKAIVWFQVRQVDISTMQGGNQATNGSGQNDIRISPSNVPYERMVDFARGSEDAEIRSDSPLDITIRQYAGASAASDIVIGQYHTATRNDIRILNQDPPDTNPRWSDVATSGSVGDYMFIARLADDSFASGWFPQAAVGSMPVVLRDAITNSQQGIRFFGDVPALSPLALEVRRGLARHHNVLLYGPPGTGKTFIMQEVLQSFTNPFEVLYDEGNGSLLGNYLVGRQPLATRWTTFHQSYTYEHFIGGRRPTPAASGGFSLTPVDGVLMDVASPASQGGLGVLFIDEINRGNVSRIFGEFITLMEPDKRLRQDGTRDPLKTVSVRLPHRDGADFSMPYHVYTLATMNSVDRSVMPLDAALRRRFHVIELRPDYPALGSLFGLSNAGPANALTLPTTITSISDMGRLVIQLLTNVNAFIRAFAGADFEVGHGYFWPLQDAAARGDLDAVWDGLLDIWNNRLLPHLLELFRTQPERLASLLRMDDPNAPARYPYRRPQLPGWLSGLGANPAPDFPELDLNDDGRAAITFLARVQ